MLHSTLKELGLIFFPGLSVKLVYLIFGLILLHVSALLLWLFLVLRKPREDPFTAFIKTNKQK